jgi:hypothetical protein
VDPYKKKIKEEIMTRLNSFNDFDKLNDLMMDLIREGKIVRYFISKKIETNSIDVKSITITSNLGFDYVIGFRNIKKDYRDFRLKSLLLSNIEKINKI